MNRREAFKRIIVVSSGVVVFPACELLREPMPVYDKLTLDRSEFDLVGDLAEAILPMGELEVKNPEPTKEFILNMINDCSSLEDCKKYVTGLRSFALLIKERYNKRFAELDSEYQQLIFSLMAEVDEATRYFFNSTRQYSIQHFTGSRYFLTNHLEWTFIPGKFEGCANI